MASAPRYGGLGQRLKRHNRQGIIKYKKGVYPHSIAVHPAGRRPLRPRRGNMSEDQQAFIPMLNDAALDFTAPFVKWGLKHKRKRMPFMGKIF
jgi:hypothetical protein